MGHPTEDELIQHLCGENAAADRERLQDHLELCAECRLACEEITGALTMVNDAVPEPPDGFERIMWAKVQQSIALVPAPTRWTVAQPDAGRRRRGAHGGGNCVPLAADADPHD
jgi:hypothetical protein